MPLPHRGHTVRLSIGTATPEEGPELHAAHLACSHLASVDPTFNAVPEAEIGGLVRRSLASDGASPEQFRMQSVRLVETGEILGYFHLSLPHPVERTAWISMFVLHPAHQRKGYGREAVRYLLQELKRADGCDEVWLRVYLKNLQALRFWIREGFTRIVKLDAEEGAESLVLAGSLRGAAATQFPDAPSAERALRLPLDDS
jgi:ribosomal protein S18 acetylase RimI-like enzyme